MTDGACFTPLPVVPKFPRGEAIVSMIRVRNRVLVATAHNIYEIKDGKLVKLEFEETPPWESPT